MNAGMGESSMEALKQNKILLSDKIEKQLDIRNFRNKEIPSYFSARAKELKDDEIEDILQQFKNNQVMTLQDLKEKLNDINIQRILLDLDINTLQISKVLDDAMTLEEKLDGKIITCGLYAPNELKLINDRFVDEATSTSVRGMNVSHCNPNIALVLGPSGSGKTFFAVKGIKSHWPTTESDTNDTPQKQCTIFWTPSFVGGGTSPSENNTLTGEDVGRAICEDIKRALKIKYDGYDEENKKLDMLLWIVLDEVVSSLREISPQIVSRQLVEIRKRLGTLVTNEENTRVIFVGTGLDSLTAKIDSVSDVYKFRMKQWKRKNLRTIVNKIAPNNTERKGILNYIDSDGLYLQLATNARAAYALVKSVKSFCNNVGAPKRALSMILQRVAQEFINNNGINEQGQEKRIEIARNIFRVLDRASRDPTTIKWPFDYNDLKHLERDRLVIALLQIDVEYCSNKLCRVDGCNFNASVSPAITVILFYMLGIFSNLDSVNWASFENLVARHELQQLLVNCQEGYPMTGLRQLKDPFPAPAATNTFYIPFVRDGHVLLNGPMAPFADVIIKNRLVQCKYVTKFEEPLDLKLDEELEKMGLLRKSMYYRKLVMVAMYMMFQLSDDWLKGVTSEDINTPPESSATSFGVPIEEGDFRRVYPSCQYLQWPYQEDECVFVKGVVDKEHKTLSWERDDRLGPKEQLDCLDSVQLDESIISFPNLQVAFYTNAKNLEIQGCDLLICASDVDYEGQLCSKEKIKKLNKHLHELGANVGVGSLRFQFVPGANQ